MSFCNFCFLNCLFFCVKLGAKVLEMPFMSTPTPLIIFCVIYLRFIYYDGIKFMKTRQPYKLTTFIRCYNIFQVIACTYFTFEAQKIGFKFNYAWMCVREYIGQNGDNELDFYWNFILLRAVELIETVVFVLRKKNNQVSFLHVYHHISTVWILWLMFRSIPGN